VYGHAELLEAICDGDAARAGEIMRLHVLDFEQAMRRALGV
jgi:DNA-binding GntR family transcriptional regulator